MRWIARAGLPLLSAVYLGLGFLILSLTPFDSFPDESAHFLYAQHIRDHRELPPLSFDRKKIEIPEGFQPPLHYGAGAILLIPSMSRQAQVLVLRIFSLLLGWGTVVFIWKCAQFVFPGKPEAVVMITAFAALNPQFIFTHSGITNIATTDFTCALLLWLLLRILSENTSLLRGSLVVGICCGLVLLSRTTTIYLIPVCVAALWLRGRSDFSRLWRSLLVFSIAAFAVAGWWYLRNWIYYEDPFLWKVHQTTMGSGWAREGGADLFYIMQALAFLHASFWAYFGRNEFHAGVAEYSLYLLVEAVALWGVMEIFLRKDTDPDFAPPQFSRKAFAFLMFSGGVALAEILLLQLRISSPQGRYLYMSMPAVATALGAGIYKAIPQRLRAIGAPAVVTFLFLMCVYLLSRYWLPHYV